MKKDTPKKPLQILLTADERKEIESAAKASGINTVSAYMRAASLDAARRAAMAKTDAT